MKLPPGIELGFCPTGPGGGVDNSCGTGSGGGASHADQGAAKQAVREHDEKLKGLYAKHKELQERLKEARKDGGKPSSGLKKERAALNKEIEAAEKRMLELRRQVQEAPPVPVTPTPPSTSIPPDTEIVEPKSGPPEIQNLQQCREYFKSQHNIRFTAMQGVTKKRELELGKATAASMHHMVEKFPLLKQIQQDPYTGETFSNHPRVLNHAVVICKSHNELGVGSTTGTMATYTHFSAAIRMKKDLRVRDDAGLTLGDHNVAIDYASVFRHEYGHKVWFQNLDSSTRAEFSRMYHNENYTSIKRGVSEYAATNREEFWAESFAAITHPRYGEPGMKRLPSHIEDFMHKSLGVQKELPEGVELAFCPTGPGGGIDNTCSPNQGGGGAQERLRQHEEHVLHLTTRRAELASRLAAARAASPNGRVSSALKRERAKLNKEIEDAHALREQIKREIENPGTITRERETAAGFFDDLRASIQKVGFTETALNVTRKGLAKTKADRDKWGATYAGSSTREYHFQTSEGFKYRIKAVVRQSNSIKEGGKTIGIAFSDARGSYGKTKVGARAALEVFSKVVPAVAALVEREQPDGVEFTASSASRVKLYDRISKTLLKLNSSYTGFVGKSGEGGHKEHVHGSYLITKKEHTERARALLTGGAYTERLIQLSADFVRVEQIQPEFDPAWATEAGWMEPEMLDDLPPIPDKLSEEDLPEGIELAEEKR